MATDNKNAGDRRRARRVIINAPVVVEAIGQPAVTLPDELAAVYERVTSNPERQGDSFPAVIRDISVGGAFLCGDPLPLMTRVKLTFALADLGSIEAIAWSLWRRTADCAIPGPDGESVELPQGFGVLFEAIPLEARIAIHNLVAANQE